MKVWVCGLYDLKCLHPGYLPWWWTPPARACTIGESPPAAALIEAAFIGIAETPVTPIRLIPNAPTATRMVRIVFPPLQQHNDVTGKMNVR